MHHEPSASRRKRPAAVAALVVASALGLSGCAQFPSLDQLAPMKPVSDYRTSGAFDAPASAWPAENWWKSYGDAQLDTLIEEALRDSPDMAAASARLRRADAFSQIAGSALLPQVSANASAS